MIRILGTACILASVALIAYRVGWECALYWASPADLVEAVRLRVGYYVGANQ